MCTLDGVYRKLVLWFAALALMLVMVGAPMHEALEHHHSPFPVDGDFHSLTVSMLVGICVGAAAAIVPFLSFLFALFTLVAFLFGACTVSKRGSPAYQRLLFSPPRTLFSLRL